MKFCCHNVEQIAKTLWERFHPSVWSFSAVIQTACRWFLKCIRWCCDCFRENIHYCRLFWWHFSVVRAVWLNQQRKRLCDACLVNSDTVQISLDPSLLNKLVSSGTGRLMPLPLNSGISLSLAGQDFGGLWVMGGNHFPCLLNKTIKRHYELASEKTFACHCLHLLQGVSGFLCFFWLFQNTVILLASCSKRITTYWSLVSHKTTC